MEGKKGAGVSALVDKGHLNAVGAWIEEFEEASEAEDSVTTEFLELRVEEVEEDLVKKPMMEGGAAAYRGRGSCSWPAVWSNKEGDGAVRSAASVVQEEGERDNRRVRAGLGF